MTVMDKVKEWLKNEVKEHQEIVDAYENGEDVLITTDEEICVGRHEVAESLLNQISKWEKENG